MANNLNGCNFIGHIGNDIEATTLQNGTTVANFNIAVGGYKKNGDQYENTTTWVSVRAFGKTAENIAKRRKGEMIRISCSYRHEQWQDNNGQNRYSHYFVVDGWEPLTFNKSDDSPKQKSAPQNSTSSYANEPSSAFDDDIPF